MSKTTNKVAHVKKSSRQHQTKRTHRTRRPTGILGIVGRHLRLATAVIAFGLSGIVFVATSNAAASSTQSSDKTVRTGDIASQKNRSECIDVKDGGTRNGTMIRIWPCNKQIAQKATIDINETGTVTIRMMDRCLDVDSSGKDDGKAEGTKVQLFQCNGSAPQRWILFTNGNMYNPKSGRCIGSKDNDISDGKQLGIYDCSTSSPMRWFYPRGTVLVEKIGPMTFQSDKNVCVDKMSALDQVQARPCNGSEGQKWGTVRLYNGGTYKYMNGTRCLGVEDSSGVNRKVVNRACTNNKNQEWKLESGRLIHVQSGKINGKYQCLDTDNRVVASGEALELHACDTSSKGKSQRLNTPRF